MRANKQTRKVSTHKEKERKRKKKKKKTPEPSVGALVFLPQPFFAARPGFLDIHTEQFLASAAFEVVQDGQFQVAT